MKFVNETEGSLYFVFGDLLHCCPSKGGEETHVATNVLQHPCICIFIRLCICELLYLYLDTLYNVDIPCCNSLTLGYLQCKPHNLSCDFDGLARLSGNTAYRSPYHPLAILSPPAF